jgi:nitrate reductase NapE component
MSMRMRSKERVSEQDAKKWAWRWSIGLVLIIGLFPLVGAFVGELIARALGCVVDFPCLAPARARTAF